MKEGFQGVMDTMKDSIERLGKIIYYALTGDFDAARAEMEEGSEATATTISKTFSLAASDIGASFVVTANGIVNSFSGVLEGVDMGTPIFGIPKTSFTLGGGGPITSFQHGGTIEAGPYRPTAFVFGEGPQRERATIEHVGGKSEGASEGRPIYNATLNIYPQRLDDYAIERAGEKLFDTWERQRRRRGF